MTKIHVTRCLLEAEHLIEGDALMSARRVAGTRRPRAHGPRRTGPRSPLVALGSLEKFYSYCLRPPDDPGSLT
jgi:hypothetical protein